MCTHLLVVEKCFHFQHELKTRNVKKSANNDRKALNLSESLTLKVEVEFSELNLYLSSSIRLLQTAKKED